MTDWERHITDTCARLTEMNRERGIDYTVWLATSPGPFSIYYRPAACSNKATFNEAAADAEWQICTLPAPDQYAPWLDGPQVVLGGISGADARARLTAE